MPHTYSDHGTSDTKNKWIHNGRFVAVDSI